MTIVVNNLSMAVSSKPTHPLFQAMLPDLISARDCYAGERAIKERGTKYLPRLSGQTNEEYNAYKMRATFYSIVGRTVTALTGIAVVADPIIEAPDEIRQLMSDAPYGLQFDELRYRALRDVQLVGRFGILVDSPQGETQDIGIQPYASEAIINWDVDAKGKPTFVQLMEIVWLPDGSGNKQAVLRYRTLKLVEGVYTVTVEDANNSTVTIQPEFGGSTIDFIPFYVANPLGLGFDIEKIPMVDLVNLNLSHYRTSADLEHGRHFCGLPTPVITGSEVSSGKMKIGGSKAWVLPEVGADAKYLEFTGQGLLSLEKALQEKESQLSSMSVNVIDRASRGSEAADTVKLRYTSETASLALVVSSVESLLNTAYRIIAKLKSIDGDIKISFAKQFINGATSAPDLAKYSEMYLAGSLSVEAYVSILRRGGALPADRDDKVEIAALTKIATDKIAAAAAAAQKPEPAASPSPAPVSK